MNPAFYQPKVNLTVMVITGFIILFSLFNYHLLETLQYGLLAMGTLFIGIPHGATDDHIFYAAGLETWLPRQRKAFFYGAYLLAAGFYMVLWWLWPIAALSLFLLLSIYHFGQSHLFYLPKPANSFPERVFYVTWGTYVLGAILLFHYEEAYAVIETLIGTSPIPETTVSNWALPVVLALFAINVLFFGFYWLKKQISGKRFLLETSNLVVLGLLAFVAPLFLAFITYWALWHSLNSVIEIRKFLEQQTGSLTFKGFAFKALPLTLVTLIGIGLLFWMTGSLGSRDHLLAIFFIVIATVTLPHSLVMEYLYEKGKN